MVGEGIGIVGDKVTTAGVTVGIAEDVIEGVDETGADKQAPFWQP